MDRGWIGADRVVTPARVRVRIPSKVNLFLAVRGRRPDGYHDIVSVMQTVTIADQVTVRFEGPPLAAMHPASRRNMEFRFTHDGGADVPDDDDNLALAAARTLLAVITGDGDGHGHHGGAGPVPVTCVHLEKHIPVAGGMAGGSADAAATLVALNHLWACELDRDELRDIAAELGADVPFCVSGGTALATGTGTATAQVLTRGTFHWVVGMSDEPLSTPAVYRAWDELGTVSDAEPDLTLHALRTGDTEALGAALHNDLEPAAFSLRPSLREAKELLLEKGAVGVIVSGSGPTVVALAESAEHADDLAVAVTDAFARVETAASPAGGPHAEADPS